MGEDRLIYRLADMPASDWKRISTRMRWVYVTGQFGEYVPPEMRDVIETLPEDKDWQVIRSQVIKVRRARYRADLEERKTRKTAERRNYMRQYMADYRRKS